MKRTGSAVAALLAVLIAGAAVRLGYTAPWTGFGARVGPPGEAQREKTLWDWMDLLIVPVALAVGAYGSVTLTSAEPFGTIGCGFRDQALPSAAEFRTMLPRQPKTTDLAST